MALDTAAPNKPPALEMLLSDFIVNGNIIKSGSKAHSNKKPHPTAQTPTNGSGSV
jgi:hypothetical protein